MNKAGYTTGMRLTTLFITSFLVMFAVFYSTHATVIVPDRPDATVTHEEVFETTSGVETHNCPDDMVEIDGLFCPQAQQECLKWVDINGTKVNPPTDGSGRCSEWKRDVKCNGGFVKKHYCIDRYEYPNKLGQVPQDWMSWNDVKVSCESESKRLCTRSEWAFAGEGPRMHPYPYGDGYHRDHTICNFDNQYNGIDVFKATSPSSPAGVLLHGMLKPSGSLTGCVSEWGVHDMAGNIDEWVVNETGHPYTSGLMGGHVFGVRNASRPMTDAHEPSFSWYETGGRCCKGVE